MNFDEWFKKETGGCGGMQEMESWAEKAWDFQQAKIDELQARIDDLSRYVSSDDFIDIRVDYPLQSKELINILKGNKQHIHKFEEITVNGDDARKYICIYCGFEKSESFND